MVNWIPSWSAAILLCIAAELSSAKEDSYCYSSDRQKLQVRQFSTKTPYQVVSGGRINAYSIPNCEPQKIWLLSRHGTTFPTRWELQKMKMLDQLLGEIKQNYKETGLPELCENDRKRLLKWQWDSQVGDNPDRPLAHQGKHDMRLLAKRYKRMYPELLPTDYTPSAYFLRHTNRQRSSASYKAFVEELFGTSISQNITLPEPPDKDTLLRPCDLCTTWRQQYLSHDKPNSEITKFKSSPYYQLTVHGISNRLGFQHNLTDAQIEAIWNVCRYEQAWYLDRLSAWCAAFTPQHVDVLEYFEDLKYYYKFGYGSDLNSHVTCHAVQDMLNHVASESGPRAVLYFGHSSTMHLFLTAIGAARDRQALQSYNYPQMKKQRAWRSSKNMPYAANLALVKYHCPNDVKKSKVLFLHNEQLLDFEWCRAGLCDYQTVIRRLQKFYGVDCSKIFCNGFN